MEMYNDEENIIQMSECKQLVLWEFAALINKQLIKVMAIEYWSIECTISVPK